MAAIGGSIIEVTYNHPTIGQGFFFPKSDAEGTIDLGGLRKADDANGTDGSGRAIYQMVGARWAVETEVSWDMVTDQELERLSQLAASPVEAEFTFSHVSGAVYGGKGTIVGDVQGASMSATSTIKFSGGGILKKI